MRLISSSVTRIVIPCLLVNIRVCLHIGNQHLLHPVEDEESLHPDQLGHNVEGYPAWQGQSIQGEFLFDPQNPSQDPWWGCWWGWRCSLPPWLSVSPSLTEILPIDPVLCDGQHFDGVVSSLEGPDLGQDHEGSLHQPDQLHLVLQQGCSSCSHSRLLCR